MAQQAVVADYTIIPDDAEVWIAFKSDVADINAMIPTSVGDVAGVIALGWKAVGLVDAGQGIVFKPETEVKKFSGFGRKNYRTKVPDGELQSGFRSYELKNPTVKRLFMPGSTSSTLGVPGNIQAYVMYRITDNDIAAGDMCYISLAPCAIQLSDFSGFVEAEQTWAEFKVHHASNSVNDVMKYIDQTVDDVAKTLTIAAGVTSYTFTAGANTTPAVNDKKAVTLQAALRALASVQALPAPGATVAGPDGGPLAVTFTAPVTPISATGTGGTANVT